MVRTGQHHASNAMRFVGLQKLYGVADGACRNPVFAAIRVLSTGAKDADGTAMARHRQSCDVGKVVIDPQG
jgi:hypothetical protein